MDLGTGRLAVLLLASECPNLLDWFEIGTGNPMMSVTLLERTLISLVFGLSGVAKLVALGVEVAAFARWGYPIGFMYFIGILEVAGAVAMWMRKLAPFVASCLAGLALGALATRLLFQEWIMAMVTAAVLVLTVHYVWIYRRQLFPGERLPPDDTFDRNP